MTVAQSKAAKKRWALKRKIAAATAKPTNAVEPTPRMKGRVKPEQVARARARKPSLLGAMPTFTRADTFRPAEPPPGVVPPGKTMAFDAVGGQSAAVVAWAGQGLIGGAWSEGLVWPGYAYLSELAQRPEYRIISNVIATEMTRKWIKLSAATSAKKIDGDADEQAENDDDLISEETESEEEFPQGNDDASPEVIKAMADLAKSESLDDENEDQTDELDVAAKKNADDKTAKIKELEDELKRLEVQDVFFKVAEMEGFMGRCHLYLDTGDTDNPDELMKPLGDGRDELSHAKLKKGGLKRIKMVEPIWCYPARYNSNDPLRTDWYNPDEWFVMGKQLHVSRLLTFISMQVPDLLKPAYSFGGLSRSQIAKPYVDNWLTTRQSVNNLIKAFSVMVLSTDLSAQLSASDSDADGSGLFNRMDLFNALRDNNGTFVLNKDTEEFNNVTTPLNSLDMLQAQSQEHMASISRIPLVKLLGTSPAGLNASSEGEIRVFYDTIAAFQEQFFRPHLTRVINFAMINLWGKVDPEITFSFEPLWSLDEKALAEVRKTEAETDDILVNGVGSLHPEESRRRIAGDSDTPYGSIDVNDMPEKQEPDMSSLGLAGHMPFGKGEATAGEDPKMPGGGNPELGAEPKAKL